MCESAPVFRNMGQTKTGKHEDDFHMIKAIVRFQNNGFGMVVT